MEAKSISTEAVPANRTSKFKGVRAGVVYWEEQPGAVIAGISHALRYLECDTFTFLYNARLPQDLEVIFVCGPFGSLAPLMVQLAAIPKAQQPALVFILTEQLPNPESPEWWRRTGGIFRSRMERLAYHGQADGWQLRSWLRWLTTKGQRYRYYGDLHWLRQRGLLSVLATSSRWTADFLRTRGFDPTVLPPSINQGEDLQLERNIPVLWLGKPGTTRRARMLQRLRQELKGRGIEMLMIDGVENPYIFGDKRTVLLNRTKITINILRQKWDDNSMRYALAASCKTLVITEPTLPHSMFEPGVHIIETAFEKMADTIHYYLEHEEERQKIAGQAYQLITHQSGLGTLVRLLESALADRQNRMAQTGGQ